MVAADWERICCSRTRWWTRGRLGDLVERGEGDVAVDSEATIEAAGGRRSRASADRRRTWDSRAAAAVRRTRAGSRTSPAPAGSRCSASWATRATSSGSRTGPSVIAGVEASMALLSDAHSRVGGDIDLCRRNRDLRHEHLVATEIQAGSYALMDTAYADLWGCRSARRSAILSTVISSNNEWAVCDAGLKSLGMDHGNPSDRGSRGLVLLRRARHVLSARSPSGPGFGRDSRSRRSDGRLPLGPSTSQTART